MSTYGGADFGSAGGYTDGVTTYTPTTQEIVGSQYSRAGGTGAVQSIGNIQVPPGTPYDNQINGGIQIASGSALIIAAVSEAIATGGLASPIAIIQALGGITQVINGISALTSNTNSRLQTLQANGFNLTPAEIAAIEAGSTSLGLFLNPDGTLTTLGKNTILNAVWHTSDPGAAGETWAEEIVELDLATEGIQDTVTTILNELGSFQHDGYLRTGPMGYFSLYSRMNITPTLLQPVANMDDILPGDTVGTWLARNNPGYTVLAGGFGPEYWRLSSRTASYDLFCGITPQAFEYLKWCFYTPSSGPPKRSLMQDGGTTLSLVPVQY